MHKVQRRAISLDTQALLRGVYTSAASLARLHPRARLERHGVECLRDIEYVTDDGGVRRLDVYRPRPDAGLGPGPWPAILYLHGGGFQLLSKDTHWLVGILLAREGYVVFNLDYRLAPSFPYPCALEDAIAGYAWMLEHGGAYGADLRRVAVAGESAGANLALSLSLACASERPEPWARKAFALDRVPDACVPACGIFQVSACERFEALGLPRFVMRRIRDVNAGYLGEDGLVPSDRTALADPVIVLEASARGDAAVPPIVRPLPPCHLTVGMNDPLLSDSRRVEAALQALGVDVEAVYEPGQPHAFQVLVWRPAARRAWEQIHRFLRRRLAFAERGPAAATA